jgi:hypothetical protein
MTKEILRRPYFLLKCISYVILIAAQNYVL